MTGSSLHNIVHSGDSSSPQSSTNIDNSNGASTKANSALNFSASPGSTHAAHSMTAREGRENQGMLYHVKLHARETSDATFFYPFI